MKHTNSFSPATDSYLDRFYCIFEQMVEGMTTAKLSGSISHNFIVQMIPHHRAAIEMSENILNYTDNPCITRIAENIITEQTKSISDMEHILCTCDAFENSEYELCDYQNHLEPIFMTMFRDMDTACATNNLNCTFMREMTPHHMGAVRMSSTTLKYRICPQLKPILHAIITSQKRGIAEMRRLLVRMC